MININSLETERLLLRPISTADTGFILELYNSPKFIEFIGDRNIRTMEDAENYIVGKFLPQMEKIGFGNDLIIRKCDSMKIGTVGIFEREGLDVHDIGFSFLPEFEGQGYGFESASKLLRTAFNEFGLKKISAITTKTNFSSQKLIGRLGLRYLKTVLIPNADEELMYYEIENGN